MQAIASLLQRLECAPEIMKATLELFLQFFGRFDPLDQGLRSFRQVEDLGGDRVDQFILLAEQCRLAFFAVSAEIFSRSCWTSAFRLFSCFMSPLPPLLALGGQTMRRPPPVTDAC